jgi:hypothetical protein
MSISLYVSVTVSKVNEPDAAPPATPPPFWKSALSNVHTVLVAIAVMANIKVTDPTNTLVRVLMVANEASTPRCGAVVVLVIEELSVNLLFE